MFNQAHRTPFNTVFIFLYPGAALISNHPKFHILLLDLELLLDFLFLFDVFFFIRENTEDDRVFAATTDDQLLVLLTHLTDFAAKGGVLLSTLLTFRGSWGDNCASVICWYLGDFEALAGF